MRKQLALDYFERPLLRRSVLDRYVELNDYADAVRESQEALELAFNGLLIFSGIDFPKAHDIGKSLASGETTLEFLSQEDLRTLSHQSKVLRKDWELAYYDAEDILPLDYYTAEDAETTIQSVDFAIKKIIGKLAPDLVKNQPQSPV